MFNNSVPTSQKTLLRFLYKDYVINVFVIYSDDDMKFINMPCGQNGSFLTLNQAVDTLTTEL
jgi:hypothetical protein